MGFRLPFLGRLGLVAWFQLVIQLTFAFTVLLCEPVVRLLFYIFPLQALSDTFRHKVLDKLSSKDLRSPCKSISFTFESLATTEDFVRFHRFPFESHFVTTEDGFILNLHRIPHSRAYEAAFRKDHAFDIKGNRPVVLFWHGFLMCSEVWVCRTDCMSNLPFLLADLGYDVWLGNTRGNKYSSKHKKYGRNTDRYWKFSIDQIAFFDLSNSVDYILNLSSTKKLTYIGFSQGTVQGFSALAIKHSLRDKVNLFIALAPIIKPHGLENKTVAALIQASPDLIYLLFGRRSFLSITLFWQSMLSRHTFASVIDIAMRLLFSWTSDYLPDKHIVYRHLYSQSSVRVLVHWFQILRTGRFQMYDEFHNLMITSVPKFPTECIGKAVPIALFWGGSDTLLDMDSLLERLSIRPVFCMQVREYEVSLFPTITIKHLHFLWGESILKAVYPAILRLLQEYALKSNLNLSEIKPYLKFNDKIYEKAKGTRIKSGASVGVNDLCWGLDDEHGRTYIEDGEENFRRKSLSGSNFVRTQIARSQTRKEEVVVRDRHGPITVFDAAVSILEFGACSIEALAKED